MHYFKLLAFFELMHDLISSIKAWKDNFNILKIRELPEFEMA